MSSRQAGERTIVPDVSRGFSRANRLMLTSAVAVTASLACHLPRSHAVQFLLHERRKGVQGALVSMTPGDQQASDVRRRTRLHPRVLSRMLAL